MIQFCNISISFNGTSGRLEVLNQFNATIERGDFTCILGPSGCGKTTLLNILAGFQTQTSGDVLVNGTSLSRADIKLSYVFQGHNIFPWKTVRQNIAFGLGISDIHKSEKNNLVEQRARDVGLYEYLDTYPESISGGMKQRVGIARALIGDPDIILMDEPFASLDALTAFEARKMLKEICRRQQTTVVLVTHNIDEALELGDRMIVASQSPMNILIDKRLPETEHTSVAIREKLKQNVYDALKSN